jgi:hypothetical protein
MAGSRVAKLPSKILLDAKKIQEEIKKAVSAEKNTTDEEVKPLVVKKVDFEALKEEVVNLVMTYFYEEHMQVVADITDEVLGLGVKINDLDAKKADALEIVKIKLEEKIDELGLK